MTTFRRGRLVLTLAAGAFMLGSMLFTSAASAQSIDCPAGGRGGSGGDGGSSRGGSGGVGFTVGGFGTAGNVGNVDASGGNAGSARGGSGGRGGSGTLPICNQNTNTVGGNVVRAAPVAAAPAARHTQAAPVYSAPAGTGGGTPARYTTGTGGGAPVRYTTGTGGGRTVVRRAAGRTYGTGGGGLASTGSRTNTELALAGGAFIMGGLFMLVGQPLRRMRAEA